MRLKLIRCLIALLLTSTLYAQDKDTLQPPSKIDSLALTAYIDSLPLIGLLDSIHVLTKLDSLRIQTDSLLKPFYTIRYDSILNSTLYEPKFRMVFDRISSDTIYKPLPKASSFIQSIKRLVADTIVVNNPIKTVVIDTTKFAADPIWWKHKNSIGFDLNGATFVNWKAGGNNSISGRLRAALVRNYKKLHMLWNNELIARYGLNQQEEKGLRKTDDRFEVNSTLGYRKDTISNWFYSLKFNFNTQFSNGYKYPDKDSPVSRLFAPAYLFLGTGFHYELKESHFSIYLSPITLKSTFLFDKILSDSGAFGVKPGANSRHEFGALIESNWRQKIVKNVEFSNRISLYSDYLNDFGNIDIDWNLNFNLSVNKYIKASLGGYLLYDDDIKFTEDLNNDGVAETVGPKIQLKQLLSIGVLYTF